MTHEDERFAAFEWWPVTGQLQAAGDNPPDPQRWLYVRALSPTPDPREHRGIAWDGIIPLPLQASVTDSELWALALAAPLPKGKRRIDPRDRTEGQSDLLALWDLFGGHADALQAAYAPAATPLNVEQARVLGASYPGSRTNLRERRRWAERFRSPARAAFPMARGVYTAVSVDLGACPVGWTLAQRRFNAYEDVTGRRRPLGTGRELMPRSIVSPDRRVPVEELDRRPEVRAVADQQRIGRALLHYLGAWPWREHEAGELPAHWHAGADPTDAIALAMQPPEPQQRTPEPDAPPRPTPGGDAMDQDGL
ncbi:MAG: hypothetical protein QM679_08200 [Patulibacter sp.]